MTDFAATKLVPHARVGSSVPLPRISGQRVRVKAVSQDNENYVKEGLNSLQTIVKNCSMRQL